MIMNINYIGEYKMNKVVEQTIKGNPFIKSVTTRKAEHSNKYMFDIETTVQCPCNINGVDTLIPFCYIHMADDVEEDDKCFKIEAPSIVTFKEAAKSLSNFWFGAKKVIFDYNRDTLEYRESLGLSESDPRHFVLVDFKTETSKILSTPSIGKDITEEGKTSYLIPVDITGLYNTDGTPNREAGYFKIEESEVES